MPSPITALLCSHPANPQKVPDGIAVSATMNAGGELDLCYVINGCPTDILIPPPQPPANTDGLWQHTCFEAFVTEEGAGSREFNFSPSGQWAAYRFSGYRERDTAFRPAAAPRLSFFPRPDGLELRATLPPAMLPPGPLQLGLTAVIETIDGHLHYWALTHCATQPDFHLRQSFTLTLDQRAS